MPRSWSGFSTVRQARPASSARARSASKPSTTTTGSRPAAIARPAARRSSVSPSSGKSSLLRPMRVEEPAASTMPATAPPRSAGMDGALLVPQVPRLAARAHREQLGDDAHRDLLRALGAELEADGAEYAVVAGGADLP